MINVASANTNRSVPRIRSQSNLSWGQCTTCAIYNGVFLKTSGEVCGMMLRTWLELWSFTWPHPRKTYTRYPDVSGSVYITNGFWSIELILSVTCNESSARKRGKYVQIEKQRKCKCRTFQDLTFLFWPIQNHNKYTQRLILTSNLAMCVSHDTASMLVFLLLMHQKAIRVPPLSQQDTSWMLLKVCSTMDCILHRYGPRFIVRTNSSATSQSLLANTIIVSQKIKQYQYDEKKLHI